MRVRVYPYKQGSASARALAHGLDGKVLYIDERSRYRPRPGDVVINWGSSTAPLQYGTGTIFPIMFNPSDKVAVATNKLLFFKAMLHADDAAVREVIVPWTEEKEEAEEWIAESPGQVQVVVRHDLVGRGGQGIELVGGDRLNHVDPRYNLVMPEAPLYTKYIKKSAEYRVHVSVDHVTEGSDESHVFDVQQKRTRRDYEPDPHLYPDGIDYQIRNHASGWVFCREDLDVPECVTTAAMLVIRELKLDFGAVDVVYNAHQGRAYVLEVNTAPGLEGTTLSKYIDMIRARVRG